MIPSTYPTATHPPFTSDDERLISYNVNSTEFQQFFDDVDLCKPRFVRMPFFQP